MRQCPDHYTIRAGRNLPDKDFRYLRTVIVTAAVYWGFNSLLAHLLLTFQHRAGVSPYTSSSIWQRPVFLIISCLGLFSATTSLWHPLFLSYGVNLPSSLTTLLPLALEFSSYLPVSVCGTGAEDIHKTFLALVQTCFPTKFRSLSPGATIARVKSFQGVLLLKSFGGYGISTVCASATPFGLTLAPGLLGADEPSSKNLRLSANMILTYFSLLIPAFSLV